VEPSGGSGAVRKTTETDERRLKPSNSSSLNLRTHETLITEPTARAWKAAGTQSGKAAAKNKELREVFMRSVKLLIRTVSLVTMLPFAIHAADFDTSKPLLCSITDVKECTPDGGCQKRSLDEVAMPEFLKFDLHNKNVTPGTPIQGRQPTSIKQMERIEGKLILQGAEQGPDKVKDGLGWTAAISEENGKLIFTASGDDVAFVAFGTCVAQ
jgi:hypothetical protein